MNLLLHSSFYITSLHTFPRRWPNTDLALYNPDAVFTKLPAEAHSQTPFNQASLLMFINDNGQIGQLLQTPDNIAQIQCLIEKAKECKSVNYITLKKLRKKMKYETAKCVMLKVNVEVLQLMLQQQKTCGKQSQKQATYSCLISTTVIDEHQVKAAEHTMNEAINQMYCLEPQIFQ